MKRLFLAFVLLSVRLFAAEWDQLPLVPGLFDVDKGEIEKNFSTLHPWKSGQMLPKNFHEAGLKSPVRLVACDIYFDGGSCYYLFRGQNNRYLAVCTDSGSYATNSSDKVEPTKKVRLFLAAFHFSDKQGVVIPADSPTERFIIKAIVTEVGRIESERGK